MLRNSGGRDEVVIKKLGHRRCGDYQLPDGVAYTINNYPVAVREIKTQHKSQCSKFMGDLVVASVSPTPLAEKAAGKKRKREDE